jgi:hypothetical protein
MISRRKRLLRKVPNVSTSSVAERCSAKLAASARQSEM